MPLNNLDELSAAADLLVMLVKDPRTSILFALLVIASVSDVRTLKIPNWLTMGGAAFGLLYSAVVPFSVQHGFMWALGGLGVGLVIMLPLYAMRVMGAGDVKLMAMAGAFLGVSDTFSAAIVTFIVGGIFAIAFSLYHRALGRMLGNVKVAAESMVFAAITRVSTGTTLTPDRSVGRLPYGVSICIGTIVYVVGNQLGFL